MVEFNLGIGLFCFVLTFVLDVLWALYIRRTSSGHKWESAVLAGLIMLVGAVNTIYFIQNHWNLIFSVIGAFLGTWVTLRIEEMVNGKDNTINRILEQIKKEQE